MKRALALSLRGLGSVSPNPLVGCVLVNNGSIIGEGWHTRLGEGHAEVNAVNNVRDPQLLKGSTAYVTLEPCSHHGRTPPCSDLLIKMGVGRVVVSKQDPNKRVNGKGIERLQAAGIQVDLGLMQDEAEYTNRRFITNVLLQRPYIILKWAQTADGFIAHENYDSRWISSAQSRQLVHKWRSEEDGILVGTNTARYDNPQLNVRSWEGRDPIRVYIDRSVELSDLKLSGKGVICLNEVTEGVENGTSFVRLNSTRDIGILVQSLFDNNIYSIIIEGGAATLQSFVSSGLWDEARVFTSPNSFERGIKAPVLDVRSRYQEKVGVDILNYYYKN